MLVQLIVKVTARRAGDQRGASAVEYGLLVALIAAVIVGAVLLLGNTLDAIFSDTEQCLSDSSTC